MSHQAAVNGRHEEHDDAVTRGPANLVSDVVTLVELQARLAALECRENANTAAPPLVAITVGLLLAAGAVPVLLIGTARLLATRLGIDEGSSMLLTAASATVVAATAVGVSIVYLRGSLCGFRRSREELRRNLAWARSLINGERRGHR
jgi:uncharacterized membrane protein YqjE